MKKQGYKISIEATIVADVADMDYLRRLQNDLMDIEGCIKTETKAHDGGDTVVLRDVAFYLSKITPFASRR